MTAMTMDHLTQGRVLLGIGTSNPQVVEGWYGQPYPRPLERTREYVDILRKVIARAEPVSYDGKHYQLPLAAGTGLGKPLRSILHPYRTEIPVYLGAEGPKNVALAAEIADGWLPMFFSPAMNDFYATALAEGFGRPGARRSAGLRRRRRPARHRRRRRHRTGRRPAAALARAVHRRHGRPRRELPLRGLRPDGLRGQARTIQDHYLAGDKKGAIAAVPTALVEDVALIGPWAKIADEVQRWRETVLTTFLASCDLRLLEKVADLVAVSPRGPPPSTRRGPSVARCLELPAVAMRSPRRRSCAVAPPRVNSARLAAVKYRCSTVRRVDAHPAVHVDGGVRDPVARVRGPELGGGDRGGAPASSCGRLASSQAACHIVSQTASTSM